MRYASLIAMWIAVATAVIYFGDPWGLLAFIIPAITQESCTVRPERPERPERTS